MCHIFFTLGRDCLYSSDTFVFWEFTGKVDTCAIETVWTRGSLRSKCHVTGVTAPMHFPLLVRLFDCVLLYHKNCTHHFILWKSVALPCLRRPGSTLTMSDLLRRLNLLEVVRALSEFHCIVISSGISVIYNNLINECILFVFL